ncbi:DoxX family protein [Paraflavisolibacter sp. H34]|uniref:DoxX family protein n=1 Tax=Huijunlia imazamoxiresistens TaxID=3127457 RepID=UPI003018AE79
MKKLFNVTPKAHLIDTALLVARLGIGGLMLTHGLPKLFLLFSGAPVQFPPVLGMSPELSLAMAVFAEAFCSVLLLLGLATRLAVIPLIITMLVAVLLIHSADPFSAKEPGLHYLLVYVVLLITGGGRYSLDNLWIRRWFSRRSTRRLEDPTLSIE